MKGKARSAGDSRALFLERFERFVAIDAKAASERTTSENYEQTWILEDTLRRIETATKGLGKSP